MDIEKVKADGIEKELKTQIAIRFSNIKWHSEQITQNVTTVMILNSIEAIEKDLIEIKELHSALNNHLCVNF